MIVMVGVSDRQSVRHPGGDTKLFASGDEAAQGFSSDLALAAIRTRSATRAG
jgi:hypothetical protein